MEVRAETVRRAWISFLPQEAQEVGQRRCPPACQAWPSWRNWPATVGTAASGAIPSPARTTGLRKIMAEGGDNLSPDYATGSRRLAARPRPTAASWLCGTRRHARVAQAGDRQAGGGDRGRRPPHDALNKLKEANGRNEAKSHDRRLKEGWFDKYAPDYMSGIDLGCQRDPINHTFRRWDVIFGDGDATHMAGVPDNLFHTVYASHLLEHLRTTPRPSELVPYPAARWAPHRLRPPPGLVREKAPAAELVERRTQMVLPARPGRAARTISLKRVSAGDTAPGRTCPPASPGRRLGQQRPGPTFRRRVQYRGDLAEGGP